MITKTETNLGTPFFAWFVMALCLYLSLPNSAQAASATEIDINVQATLQRFKSQIAGGEDFLKQSAGVLIFPNIIKAGLVIGGEYGEGALLVNNKTVNYYNSVAASFGLQAGVQFKTIVIVFMTTESLNNFRNSSGWEAGVDGSVALVEWGVGKEISTVNIPDPIVGFVFDNKGLMLNLTLEGAKFTKIVR